jgi:NAD+ synthase
VRAGSGRRETADDLPRWGVPRSQDSTGNAPYAAASHADETSEQRAGIEPAAPAARPAKREKPARSGRAPQRSEGTPRSNGAGPEPPRFPATNFPLVERVVVAFVRDEVRRVGLDRVVLGLSGGVDSACAAAIAARALGADHVLGVIMPYRTSSPASEADARAAASALGIDVRVVDISPQVDAYFAQASDASKERRGNKMARERMTILYDLSAAERTLVLGTSNKTELLLGYGTLYGDMASALNPIGDLYKTQIWGLAEHLGVPERIVKKAPSADLWEGQTDEHELGFEYAHVDALLYRMVDERWTDAELVAAGFETVLVTRVHAMVRGSQFKRRLPLIAKISERTIDADFRYPRDWGT